MSYKQYKDYLKRKERRDFLLKLFPDKEGYAELEIDDNVYVKRWDDQYKIWTVATYTKDSLARYKAFLVNKELDQEMDDRIAREY